MARKLSRRALATHYVTGVLAGVAPKKLSLQLAAYLIESRRTKELSLMIRDIQYYLAEKGYMTGSVTTAHEISESLKNAIQAYAKKKTGATTLKLDPVIDEAVLGGIKIDLPGHELNTTIARQLTILKTKYKKA
jgi:F0F1-type ATP synthase delta subunit